MNKPSPSSALKQFVKSGSAPELRSGAAGQFHGSDREFAIVIAGSLDNILRDALLKNMRHLTPTETASLREGYGPLSTFSARIAMTYALKIIGKEDRDDLIKIKEIRNAFAHSAQPLDFSKDVIADVCALLKGSGFPGGQKFGGVKAQFAMACDKVDTKLLLYLLD